MKKCQAFCVRFCGQNKKIHHLKAALPIPGEVRPPSVDTVYTDSIIFLSFLQTVQPLRLLYFSALIRFIPWKKQQKNNSRSLRKRIFENRLFIVVQTPSGRQASSGSPADPPGGSAPDRETTPRRRKAARQGSRMVLRESQPRAAQAVQAVRTVWAVWHLRADARISGPTTGRSCSHPAAPRLTTWPSSARRGHSADRATAS